MIQKTSVYKLFCKEIERMMHLHLHDVKSNIKLAELVEHKAFELYIHPKLATALVNFYWAGFSFGLEKAYTLYKKEALKR